MRIIDTNDNSAALCVGKAANPFKVFVVPRLFVFNVLTFVEMQFHIFIIIMVTILCFQFQLRFLMEKLLKVPYHKYLYISFHLIPYLYWTYHLYIAAK